MEMQIFNYLPCLQIKLSLVNMREHNPDKTFHFHEQTRQNIFTVSLQEKLGNPCKYYFEFLIREYAHNHIDKNPRHTTAPPYLDFSLCPSRSLLSQITLLSLVMSSQRIFAKTQQFSAARRRRIFITRPGAGKMLDTICLNISKGVELGPEGTHH